MSKSSYFKSILVLISFAFFFGILASPAFSKVELKVAYQPYSIHNQQIEWMKKWGAQQPDVDVVPVPLSYEIYFPKVSNALKSSKGEYDVVWHNDDWGAAWMNLLEYVDDVPNFDKVLPHLWNLCFKDKNGRSTGVPFVATSDGLYYRKDLIADPPKTWQEVQEVGKKLQQEGKVKYGFVAGMKYPHDYSTQLAFMWSNFGDILLPPFERDNEMLAMFGWQPFVDNIRVIEMVEFFWDQLHVHKTIPSDMISFSRTAAQAIFMAGDAAMFGQSAILWGDLNDPAKSKVAGNVGYTGFPYGPHGNGQLSWDVSWGWGIPKNIPAEHKKYAKELVGYMLTDEVQTDMFQKTGGNPVTSTVREALRKKDPLFNMIAEGTFAAPVQVVSAYYFPKWPQVHNIFTDYTIKAFMGKREDIPKVMQECSAEIDRALAE